jgi:hypothetical protein
VIVYVLILYYNDVRNEAQREATSLVSLYDVVGSYPPETGDHVRHDLVCSMRSVVDVPPALWGVIYVGAFLVFLLFTAHYLGHPSGRALALGSVFVLITVLVGLLATLDQPYGLGVRVQPSQMRQAISLVSADETNPVVLAPCT